MALEVAEGAFRDRIDAWLARPRARVWVATPFMSFRIAQWLATVAAARRGDRRLLVSWDARSLDELYLNAAGVEAMRRAGFEVRNLRRLHAKVVVAGSSAYIGSGNLTAYGLDGGNVEIGAFLSGACQRGRQRHLRPVVEPCRRAQRADHPVRNSAAGGGGAGPT